MTARRVVLYAVLAGLLAAIIGIIADDETCCRYGWCSQYGESYGDCMDRMEPPYVNGDGC